MRINSLNKQYSWLVVVPVLLLTFVISLDGITRYSIRRDELTTLGHIGALNDKPSSVPISFTLNSLATYSADHAPLFYVLINRWSSLNDFNYHNLRMLSVWFGMITLAGMYWLGKRLSNHRTGLFAALLIGTNVIFYSNVHEMREWSMLTAITVLSWMCYHHIVSKSNNVRWYEYFALLSLVVLGLYTSYLVVIFWLAVGLYHLVAIPKNKKWWLVSTSVILGGLLFLPWLPVFIRGLGFAQSHIDRDNPKLINVLELFELIPTFWGNGLIVVFLLLFALGLYASWKNWKTDYIPVFFFVTMLSILIIINALFPFLKRMRYLVFLMPPFILLASFGLAKLSQIKILRYSPILIIILWMGTGYLYTYSDDFNEVTAKDRGLAYPDYPLLVPLLEGEAQKRDLLIQTQYDFSAIQKSKQGFSSIDDYYMQDLKLKIVDLPLYVQWEDSGIDATPVEYATGLILQYDDFWFNYQTNKVTAEILEFQDVVAVDYEICQVFGYGERSSLVQYIKRDAYADLCNHK